jgi:hypothetical protein
LEIYTSKEKKKKKKRKKEEENDGKILEPLYKGKK